MRPARTYRPAKRNARRIGKALEYRKIRRAANLTRSQFDRMLFDVLNKRGAFSER